MARQFDVNVRKVFWKNSKGEQWAWACEYTVRGKRHRETQGQDKKLADRRADEIEEELRNRHHTPKGQSITVAKFAEQVEKNWQDRELIGNLQPATHKMYRRVLHNQIVPLLGHELLCDVDTDMCQAIVRQFLKDGNPGKAETFARVVSVMLSLAIKKKYRADHPFRHDRIALPPPCRRGEEDMPTLDKLGRILEIAEQCAKGQQKHTPLWTEAYVKLGLFQGLRLQEAAALPFEFIDWEHGLLKVRQAWCRARHDVKVPKSKHGLRDLPLDVNVADVIDRVRFYSKRNEGIILLSPRSGICTYASVRTHYWPKLMAKAGFVHTNSAGNIEPDFDFHALRHMYGSLLLKKGVPVPEAARLMGDAIETFMRVYAHEIADLGKGREAIGAISSDLMSRRGLPAPALDATELREIGAK